jgi:myosin-15
MYMYIHTIDSTGTQEARNEKLHTPLNIDQALDARDAIAKALYRYCNIFFFS